jgi:lysyl-tRNA synthetase class I
MNKTLVNNDEIENVNYKNYELLNSIPNENLINMANTIDTISLDDLNGTTMEILNSNTANIKLPIQKLFNKNNKNNKDKNINDIKNNNDDNETLIKSITKEILNNLQDQEQECDDCDDCNEIEDFKSSSKKEKMKNLKSSKSKEAFNNYYGVVFDKCYGIKDFVLLFSIYFLLSQDMIKDFFSKYFTSLNADSEGKVNVQGVIIYGLILTVLFTMTRKLF